MRRCPVYIVKNCSGITTFVLFLLSAAAEVTLLILFCIYALYACRFCPDSLALFIILGIASLVLFFLSAWTYFRSVHKDLPKPFSQKEEFNAIEMERQSSESNDLRLPDEEPEVKASENASQSRKCKFQPRYLLYGLTILLSLFILIITIGFIIFSNGSSPQVSGTISLQGLTDRVVIDREPNGK
jgi:hypothetical protein